MGIKPGWTRVTLPLSATEEDIEFILSAIELVADDGDAFLPMYELGWRDDVWSHREWRPPAAPFELSLASPRSACRADRVVSDEDVREERARYLAEARAQIAALRKAHPGEHTKPPTGEATLDALVWFGCAHATGVPTLEDAALSGPPMASD